MPSRFNSPYTPSFLTALDNSKVVQLKYADFDLLDSNVRSSDSFKYDPNNFPLKSTQQLNVDWSKFENHCFFSSAEVKVNEAFNKIINEYPFDGTKKEVEVYLDSLTGFEKWVFDSFPKWSGGLHFSGTQVNEDPSNGFLPELGTHLVIRDSAGTLFPDISKNKTGENIINPDDNVSFTIETLVKLPMLANDNQVIFQKKYPTGTDCVCLYLTSSTSTSHVTGVFVVTSGSYSNQVSASWTKGEYNHICVTLDKANPIADNLRFFVNERLSSESVTKFNFKKLDIDNANAFIGSGSAFGSPDGVVTPRQTLSGTLDEFRVFHAIRDEETQLQYASRGLYSTPSLKLYYRFNEPNGIFSNNPDVNSVVLDSSGNSLHSNVRNYNVDLRVDMFNEPQNPMENESDQFKIVLFPSYSEVTDLNASLLSSASSYDSQNPNIILKLIPKHYLLEGAAQDGFKNVEGLAGEPYGGDGIPGQGKVGPAQIILTFLYIWAKFFDEIKIYIDSFVTQRSVAYDVTDTTPDNFLDDIIRGYGIYLPKFFNNATLEQFAEGKNLPGLADLDTPLKKLQAVLTRRVLINMNDILRSKGTLHSVRSFLRSIGIDPDNSLRIREYGGSKIKQITTSRDKRTESLAMIDFAEPTSFVVSPPLSASRIEPGFPLPRGSFVTDPLTGKNVDTNVSTDGFLTSGSWHVEGIFKVPPQRVPSLQGSDQSLLRLITTGSQTAALGYKPSLIANVIATQKVEHPYKPATLQLFMRPGSSLVSPLLHMQMDMSGAGIFDGDKWNVAIGCFRNDEIGSNVSSSYYLRAAKADIGERIEYYTTSSFFYEKYNALDTNILQDRIFASPHTYNVSGTYICVGSNQQISTAGTFPHLNGTSVAPAARQTNFIGWASNLRFWSKGISIEEWKEHVRNPKSLGVADPKINYNFTKNVTGSFQKLRLDTLQKQAVDERNADFYGKINFRDFSLNLGDSFGTGFVPRSKVMIGDVFAYTNLSPHFDEASSSEKIRIRSFLKFDADNAEDNPWASEAPSYLSVITPSYQADQVFVKEEPQDDLRFSIEFSLSDSLSRDMINMFSSLDPFNNYLGGPEMMHSPDYPDLEVLRDVYYNRLSDKPSTKKFLEFYKWFDMSISTFIEQLLPGKTKYKGTNYVIESHLLERHKKEYPRIDFDKRGTTDSSAALNLQNTEILTGYIL